MIGHPAFPSKPDIVQNVGTNSALFSGGLPQNEESWQCEKCGGGGLDHARNEPCDPRMVRSFQRGREQRGIGIGETAAYLTSLPSSSWNDLLRPGPPQLIKLDLGCGSNKRQDNGPWIGVDSIAFPGVDQVVDLCERQKIERVKAPAVGTSGLSPAIREVVEVFKPWPWADNSVTEIHCSHFLEHLTNFEGRWERVHFFNELHRVLVPSGKATLIFPHWCSNRYYGDPTHKEPFSEMGFWYLNREWRLGSEKGCLPCKGTGYVQQPMQNAQPCQPCGSKGKIITPAQAPHTDITHNPNGYSCDFDWTYGHGINPQWINRSQETQQFAFANYKESITDIIATITKRS